MPSTNLLLTIALKLFMINVSYDLVKCGELLMH